MHEFIDDFLDRTTMYRLALYSLLFLLGAGIVLSFFGILSFSPVMIIALTAFLLIVCLAANEVFARVFEAHANTESAYITALILALILTPDMRGQVGSSLSFWFWAGTLAMASKYILASGKKHIFNPAAVAVALTAFFAGESASWWIGTRYMLPFVLIVGILMTRKILRWDLVLSFFVSAFATLFILGGPVYMQKALFDSPLVFFAFIMLTEPLTTPPTRVYRIFYGVIVGILFFPNIHVGSVYSTPELALILGNLYSYSVSPKYRLILRLKEKIKVASAETYDFVFSPDRKMNFLPGQYMEWTLSHKGSDNRGVRRYFTMASSPTETEIHIGVKFYDNPSTFKKTFLNIQNGSSIMAGQLSGDFTLPADKNKKLVFIAGGIGITPFRSMIKYLIDTGDKRDIILLYSNKTESEIAYREIFEEAREKLGINTVYINTDKDGFITGSIIAQFAPDFKERHFYISGPHSMTEAFRHTLSDMGVSITQIKTDFFPGYA